MIQKTGLITSFCSTACVVLKKWNSTTCSKEDKNETYLVNSPNDNHNSEWGYVSTLPSSSSNTYDVSGKPILFGKLIKVKLAELQNSRAPIIYWLALSHSLVIICRRPTLSVSDSGFSFIISLTIHNYSKKMVQLPIFYHHKNGCSGLSGNSLIIILLLNIGYQVRPTWCQSSTVFFFFFLQLIYFKGG